MSEAGRGTGSGELAEALRLATDTRLCAVEAGCRREAAWMFEEAFGPSDAVVVADERTFAAAGREVLEVLQQAGRSRGPAVVLAGPVAAESSRVDELTAALAGVEAVPVAVGSGTINDLTKLAAHRLGRPYLAVATAASMDGYTAFGASITHEGSKQTFSCPAPRAVLADLDVIARAPRPMNAWGHADLLAKIPAGADWIVADALGEEAIDPRAWDLVHAGLDRTPVQAAGVRRSDPAALRGLTVGLLMSGLAMQAARSSRPASGAEHQFSHLWDMQHHTYEGAAPSHGFKVGIGTLASLAFYEALLAIDIRNLDPDAIAGRWPTLDDEEARIDRLFGPGPLADKARGETRAKHPTREAVRRQLERLRDVWPTLAGALRRHLVARPAAAALLREAGCPVGPEEIGIDRARLRRSFEQAYYIRRRFTVLDLVRRLGLTDPFLGGLFGPGGPWSLEDVPA